MTPRWISTRALLYLHKESLAQHGGLDGIDDEGLLTSALARPQNFHAYESETDLARLAAYYAVGINRNHPFRDGNKRVGFLAIGLFLGINGYRLVADPRDAIETMLGVAAGTVDDEALAEWIRPRMQPRS